MKKHDEKSNDEHVTTESGAQRDGTFFDHVDAAVAQGAATLLSGNASAFNANAQAQLVAEAVSLSRAIIAEVRRTRDA